jgi:hypothetical protein
MIFIPPSVQECRNTSRIFTALHSAVAQAEGYRAAGLHVRREPIETVHPVVRVHPVAHEWPTKRPRCHSYIWLSPRVDETPRRRVHVDATGSLEWIPSKWVGCFCNSINLPLIQCKLYVRSSQYQNVRLYCNWSLTVLREQRTAVRKTRTKDFRWQ